jgi:hypothetical protein
VSSPLRANESFVKKCALNDAWTGEEEIPFRDGNDSVSHSRKRLDEKMILKKEGFPLADRGSRTDVIGRI